jgi:1-acyl-sn-glycerol-3-phosphate acyltransferase
LLKIIALTVYYTYKVNRALKKYGENIYYDIARKWSQSILNAAKIDVNVSGQENLKKDETYVFASNHSDLFDIPVLHIAIPNDFRIIYKKELEKIPIFGSGLARSPYIGIIRENPQKAIESVEEAVKSAAAGKSVLVFPEGTRTKDGKLGTFKRGGFMIASRSGKPVVPVAVTGTFGISSSSKFSIKSAVVNVQIGEPVYKTTSNSKEEKQLMNEIREKIAGMLK